MKLIVSFNTTITKKVKKTEINMEKRKKHRTDFLLPHVSFLVGMGSVFNISGNYFKFNTSDDPNEADCRALESDWKNIGDDFREAFTKLEKVK